MSGNQKKIFLMVFVIFLSILLCAGCFEKNVIVQDEEKLLVVMDEGYEGEYCYVDVQNIGSESVQVTVNFELFYDLDKTGSGDYGGGTSGGSPSSSRLIVRETTELIEAHQTERLSVFYPFRGYVLLSWKYDID